MSTLLQRTTSTAASTLALAAAFGLTACSASAPVAEGTTPAATSTAQAAQTIYNECLDGAAQIWEARPGSTSALSDCTGVNIISSDATITLGTVEVLTIEGSNNTITYTGDAPDIIDEGTGNTVEAAS